MKPLFDELNFVVEVKVCLSNQNLKKATITSIT